MSSNVIKLFSNIVGLSEEKMKERRAIRELDSLTDRELSDLGLNRSNIRSAVRHGVDGRKRAA